MKTLTYGAMHFCIAFGVSYSLTGSFTVASAIAVVEPAVQTVAYFFHEKAWVKFQKKRNQVIVVQETQQQPHVI